MKKRGLILLDTKYEFGVDEKGVIHVIDEADSRRSSVRPGEHARLFKDVHDRGP